ncbi:MAG: SDR family NAD(P)-dependent oxidoreductase, partial [Elusimicrobia bacterium]|nr:SDR family NAD(P)-dependent oxidoreductase [Elusimicrobiota bacterium]
MTKRTVMITGASRGLGRALALAFAPQAARLVLTAREKENLADSVAAVRKAAPGCAVRAAGGDLSNRDGVDKLLAELGSELLGGVD